MEGRPTNPQFPETVLLHPMEFTFFPLNQRAWAVRKITPAIHETLKILMDTGLKDSSFLGVGTGAGLGRETQIFDLLGIPGGPELPALTPKLVPQIAPTPAQPQRGPSPSPGPSTGPTVP
jgi:hypothetical protein